MTFVASTRTVEEILAAPMPLTPGSHLVENYLAALAHGAGESTAGVGRMMVNSLISALVIAIGKIAISLLSAFAIVYFRFPLRTFFFWMIFVTLMLPVEVRILPTYQVVVRPRDARHLRRAHDPADRLGDGDVPVPPVLPHDPGRARRGRAHRRRGPAAVLLVDVVVPMSRTNIAALFVILFIYGWNQYLWPLLVTTQESMYTTVIGIRRMISGGDAATEWNLVMATAMLAMLPPALVVIAMQRWFVKGLVDSEKVSDGQRPTPERHARATAGSEVIHGIDCDVADGEFIVIVGPSGCGKSTLLRMVAGLEEITGGEIVIGDRVVNALEPKDRDIAMVFQNYALYPHMSVFDNMAYGLKIRGLPKDDIEARVDRAADDPRARAAARAQAAGSSPAASASASRWGARSCASRRCSCSTSRCRTSTRSCACRCASRSRSCTGAWGRPAST